MSRGALPKMPPLWTAEPAEHEEGYDPHPEHRDYELLKEEMRKTRDELAKVRAHERALEDALAEQTAAKPAASADKTDWKRAIILSEILGTPRSRKRK